MAGRHAICSPSGAEGWTACPGWRGGGDSNRYSAEGTAAHDVAAACLIDEVNAHRHIGRVIHVDGFEIKVDEYMAAHVQKYLDYVRAETRDGTLLVEQRLSIEHITGEPEAEGTSDAVILRSDTLTVVDLKFGMGHRVNAQQNKQLMIYAHAAVRAFDSLGDITRVRLAIHQPRLDHISEWECSVDDLEAFAHDARKAAYLALSGSPDRNPGDAQCRWCSHKAACPALTNHALTIVADDFVDVTREVAPQLASIDERLATLDEATLGRLMGSVDLIEDWCKAVRGRVERQLLDGIAVPGWKLVEGRRGARKWADEGEAEAMLKTMRLKHDQMYDYSIVSPVTAEKLARAGAIGPRQWPKLQSLITQTDGKPSVAPESDKRPALVMAATVDDFDDVSNLITCDDLL